MILGFEPILGYHPEKVMVSNSEIQQFKQCRRRWMLKYYLALADKNEKLTGPLPLGTRVHNALEQMHLTGVDPVDEYNRLFNVDAVKFAEVTDPGDEDTIKKFNDEGELGRLMIEGYQEWLDEENPDFQFVDLEPEVQIEYDLKDVEGLERYSLIGKIDLKARDSISGHTVILDHKTSAASNFKDYELLGHLSEQLKTYILIENRSNPNPEKRIRAGVYDVLKKVKRSARAKPPFFYRTEISFNKKTIDSHEKQVLATLRDIDYTRRELDKGTDHRDVAYSTMKMDWTSSVDPKFTELCVMMDDGSYAEDFAQDFFYQRDPYQRYK